MIKFLNWMSSTSSKLSAAQERDILNLVQVGREVEAVRQIRRWTNASLPAAVNMVAEYRSSLTPLAGD